MTNAPNTIQYNRLIIPLTWVTVIACFKIGRDVGGTAAVPTQSGVEYSESATVGAGALGVHEFQVVFGTSEVAVVAADTATEPHASV